MASGPLGWIDAFLLSPILGYAIFSCKRWSYPVFIGVTVWVSVSNYLSWKEVSSVTSPTFFIVATVLNAVLVGYFLIPQVRITYMNPRIRWWEAQTRYLVDFSGQLSKSKIFENTQNFSIANISEGGAMIYTSETFESNDEIFLSFNYMNKAYFIRALVVYRLNGQASKRLHSYGVHFQFDEGEYFMARQVRNLIKAFRILGVESRTPIEPWPKRLHQWVTTLLSTGRGLIPEFASQNVIEFPKAKSKRNQDTSKAA